MPATDYRLKDAICILRELFPVPIGAIICRLCIEPHSIGTNEIFVLKAEPEPKIQLCSLTTE